MMNIPVYYKNSEINIDAFIRLANRRDPGHIEHLPWKDIKSMLRPKWNICVVPVAYRAYLKTCDPKH